jgi:hypothetical protein
MVVPQHCLKTGKAKWYNGGTRMSLRLWVHNPHTAPPFRHKPAAAAAFHLGHTWAVIAGRISAAGSRPEALALFANAEIEKHRPVMEAIAAQ